MLCVSVLVGGTFFEKCVFVIGFCLLAFRSQLQIENE